MLVAFFIRHFTERGTEVSIYDYAHFNETILGNKSVIVCFTPEAQERHKLPSMRNSYKKFADRFPILEIEGFHEMPHFIQSVGLDFFYTQTYGGYGDIYNFNNRNIWVPPCKTIKHCVFNTDGPEADFYISIGKCNDPHNRYLTIPYISYLPPVSGNMRAELGIPENALVFGRHGGLDQFDIEFVKTAIKNILKERDDIYFVFLNTAVFHTHPHIIYLDANTNMEYKVRFINTCDAMIHARSMGETFGAAVSEFSFMNKPVFTSTLGGGDKEHIRILGERAVIYQDYDDLMDKFARGREIVNSRAGDWYAYQDYSPEKVMELFRTHIFEVGAARVI